MRRQQRRRGTGFTLIEMMIVVLVIAILALLVSLAVKNAGHRSRVATQTALLHDLNGAVALYEIDCNQYPATLQDLLLNTGPPGHQGYPYYGRGRVIPKDPVSGLDFVYDPNTGAVSAP